MSFSTMFKQGNVFKSVRKTPVEPLSEIVTGNPVYGARKRIDGLHDTVYHKNLIALLDKVFLHNAVNFLSIDQERYVNKFIAEAHEVTLALQADSETPFSNMDRSLRQLDVFLGTWKGELNEQY